jgi:hypothetical protein
MANRYTNSSTIKDSNGKRRKGTAIIPVPAPSSNDVYIQVTSAERLDLLAHKFYNDANLWYIIAAANGLGKGSLMVPINSRLRIPDSTTIQQQIETLKTSR